MKIVVLGGSLRSFSYTYQVLGIALKKINHLSIPTELIDLRTLHLPFCNGDNDYPAFPDVERLRATLRSASGLIIATPEYHGSISGVLKNALDLVNEEDLAGKVVGLIGVIGGVHSTNALNTLRVICRQLRCWVLPEQLVIPHAEESFTPEGGLKDPLLDERLDQLIGHLIAAARKLGQQ